MPKWLKTKKQMDAKLAKQHSDEYWLTKEGDAILVGDMEEHHVKNALRLILRRLREAGITQSVNPNNCDHDFFDDIPDDWGKND